VYDVFHPEKNTCCIVEAPEVLGMKGYWRLKLITFNDPSLNLYLVSERNHVK
jgi:hypothetical protein